MSYPNNQHLTGEKCVTEGCEEERAVAKSGHVYPRCRTHHRELHYGQLRAWKEKNPDYDAEYMRKWREANPERNDAINKRFRENHGPEYWKEVTRRHLDSHPGITKERKIRYRAAHPGSSGEEKRRYAARHPDRVAAQRERDRGKRLVYGREYMRKRYKDDPEGIHAIARRYRARHPDRVKAGKIARRSTPYTYLPMDPWPTDCQVCHLPMDPTALVRTPMGASVGHEPPLKWMREHPEYEGPFILRPEHHGCNSFKNAHPDWELPEKA